MTNGTNIGRLEEAGIIPSGYVGLSDAEKDAINSLTNDEVEAIISAASKVDDDFMQKHAPHGMAY